MEGMLATGRIRKPHGLKGYLKVESFSGETGHLMRLRKILLEGPDCSEKMDIEDVSGRGASMLLKLKGVDNPDEARRFTNWTIWVDRKKAAARKRNEFYAADLRGCALIFAGKKIGVVDEICEGESDTFLEVRNLTGESYLIPFLKHYFGKVDVKTKRIELLAPWLLE